jgi:fumarate reductase subunit C
MFSRKVLIAVFILAAVLTLGAFALQTGADETSGCVDCHTNPAVMKAMVVVPKLGGGEGEG